MSHISLRNLSGNERFLGRNELIVSKTDLQGRIIYANTTFIKIGLYKEKELLGKPHSIIRHPDMPRCVFKLLWDKIAVGEEVFAYVINRAKNGDHYWVFAHVTASYDEKEKLVGYHSSRRAPNTNIVKDIITPLYQELCEIEASYTNSKEGMQASYSHLLQILKDKKMTYDELIFSLQE